MALTEDDVLHVARVVWKHSRRGLFEFDDVLQEVRIVALTEEEPGYVYYKTLNALTGRYKTRRRMRLACDVSREIDVTTFKATKDNLDVVDVPGLLSRLSEVERFIVRRVFWDEQTLRAISEETGYSYSFVWKKYWRALVKMGAKQELTTRHSELLELTRQGLTLSEAAKELGISRETARSTRKEARRRLRQGETC